MEQKNTFIQNDHNNQLIQPQQQPQQPQIQQTEQEGNFKWVYGVNLFNTWFLNRMTQLKANSPSNNNRLPDDLLKVNIIIQIYNNVCIIDSNVKKEFLD